MATPITADHLVSILRGAHIPLVLHEGWRTHNRNKVGPWGPVHGVMLHHTVTKGLRSTLSEVIEGRPGLPGPLYHGVVDKEGICHMIGWGRANHAGAGDDDVLRAVIAERAPLPPDNEANTDGNRVFYGFSGINLGDRHDPWPAAQLETLGRVAGAICKAHGWTKNSVIGHREWQPGKVDPLGPEGDLMPRLRGIAHGVIA